MVHLARSKALLFVPGDQEKRLEKAARTAADAVIVDLEDSVAPEAKTKARANIPYALAKMRELTKPCVVRVNMGDDLADDLRALAGVWPDAVMVPKMQDRADVVAVRHYLYALGAPASVALIALIETPAGVLNLQSIASACSAGDALAFGGEDYAAAMGVAPEEEELAFAANFVAVAARANGMPAFGVIGSITEIRDQGAFLRSCLAARRAGYCGAMTIHPAQIATAIKAFSPGPEEVEWAIAVIEDAKGSNGAAVGGRDGRMIDRPVLDRAIAILDRAGS